ncbi:MAG: hypothetical protein OXI96_01875 [Acidimicrobiaceae bacterium]|nr:hypothetical protein [Acidimicrobiaceae bacterium]
MNDPSTDTTTHTEHSGNDDQPTPPEQSASSNNELPQPSEDEPSHNPSATEDLAKSELEYPGKARDSTPKSDATTTEENLANTEKTKQKPRKSEKTTKSLARRIDAVKPPLFPLVVTAILLCMNLWLFTNPISPVNASWLWFLDRLTSNSFGYALGSFLGVLPLTAFLRSNAQKRAAMNYKEWQTVPSHNLILWVAGANWICGAIHLFLWITELVTT